MKDINDFYQFYLSQHKNKNCRRLHFIGTTFGVLTALYFIYNQLYIYLLISIVLGYLPAWIGHYFFEKNRPATFKYPLKSFLCDFYMYWDILKGKIPW